MQILGKSYSSRISELRKQTEFIGNRPVHFYHMDDCPPKAFLRHAIGYTHVCTDEVAIFLTDDVSEIDVAHELMEAQLCLEGFPSLAVRRKHSYLFNFAQLLDSTIGHIEVNRRLKAKGFDVRKKNEESIQELLREGKRQPPHDSTTNAGRILSAALGYVDKYFRHDQQEQLDALDQLYTEKFPEAKKRALEIIRVIKDTGYTDPTSALDTVSAIVGLLGLSEFVISLTDGEPKTFSEWVQAMRDC